MTPQDLLAKVKENLILTHDQDDDLLLRLIAAAINYAESYPPVAAGFYKANVPPAPTKHAGETL